MGLEQARENLDTQPINDAGDDSAPGDGLSSSSNGDLAPDSSSSSNVLDLSKTEKFLWDGKEMTPDDLRKNFLRQQDYTKKTQAIAEERRRFEQERQEFIRQQEEHEKFEQNIDADIQNVLREPSLEAKFKEIYPAKYHRILEKALDSAFGDANSPKRAESLLEQRLKSIEGRFQSQDAERAKAAFEAEVSKDEEILASAIDRFSSKYPHADEDSVLARAEHMAMFIKKDDKFKDNFSTMLEKLYKENHAFHENRYKQIYKQQVERQKQANSRGRDIGNGGATPGAAPTKLRLKDVKNHILDNMG